MFGDKVIQATAEAIKSSFRSRDIVSRIGGDEFMVLMKDIANIDLIKDRCVQLLNALSNCTFDDNTEYHVHCSIGVALSPYHATTYEKLFKFADEALYNTKGQGKNTYTIYNASNIYYY